MDVRKGFLGAIGRTPLIRLERASKETGCEILTAGVAREVKDIETLMKKDGIPQILKKAGQY